LLLFLMAAATGSQAQSQSQTAASGLANASADAPVNAPVNALAPAPAPAASAAEPQPTGSDCARLAPSTWPSGVTSRGIHLVRMRLGLRVCIGDADFLAAFGGLMLEDGDAAQALTWLERALLLDPGNLGAQADHALALAAMGEPDALRELSRRLLARRDLPSRLRAKLNSASTADIYQLPQARLGADLVPRRRWGVQGEINLQLGTESNLDRSPRLTELTLSIPEGPLVLPVVSTPRSAAATLGTGTFQVAATPAAGLLFRSGLNLNLRRSAAEPGTDWRQVQWGNQVSFGGRQWTGQLDASSAWIGGPLNEPYRLLRLGASAEAAANGCRARLGYAHEERRQSVSAVLDAATTAWALDLRCAVPMAPGWAVSTAHSEGQDRPRSGARPGGLQRLQTSGLRVVGPLDAQTQVDLGVRISQVRDEVGYSALLERNTVRRVRVQQFSIELVHALDSYGWAGFSATLHWQQLLQASNLKLFAYRSESLYAGLRWAW